MTQTVIKRVVCDSWDAITELIPDHLAVVCANMRTAGDLIMATSVCGGSAFFQSLGHSVEAVIRHGSYKWRDGLFAI